MPTITEDNITTGVEALLFNILSELTRTADALEKLATSIDRIERDRR
jgi:hypothetical protein